MMKENRILKFSPVVAGTTGVGISLVISLILLLVGASLVSKDRMQADAGNYFAVCVQVIAGLIGCLVGGRTAGEKIGVACCVAGGGYLLMLTIISLLFFNGLDSTYLWGMCAIGICCIAAIILCGKNVNHKRKKRKRFR